MNATALDEATRSFQRWNYGVLGAAMASWGIFVAFIARYPFRSRERWAWNGLLVGLLVWFLVDTLITLKYQVYFNVILNVGLLVLILVPLVLTRKEMTQSRKETNGVRRTEGSSRLLCSGRWFGHPS